MIIFDSKQDRRELGLGKVAVYRFQRFGIGLDQNAPSEIHATRAAIDRFGGIVIVSTAMEVNESDLDEHGRYIPVRGTGFSGLFAFRGGEHGAQHDNRQVTG